jgi:hypothetical protein
MTQRAIDDTDPEIRIMTDTPPDRLAINPKSAFHNAALLERGVGIRFNGVEKTNVEEYCVSEGWVRVAAGKARDRFGQPMTVKLSGKVEPYFRDGAATPESEPSSP